MMLIALRYSELNSPGLRACRGLRAYSNILRTTSSNLNQIFRHLMASHHYSLFLQCSWKSTCRFPSFGAFFLHRGSLNGSIAAATKAGAFGAENWGPVDARFVSQNESIQNRKCDNLNQNRMFCWTFAIKPFKTQGFCHMQALRPKFDVLFHPISWSWDRSGAQPQKKKNGHGNTSQGNAHNVHHWTSMYTWKGTNKDKWSIYLVSTIHTKNIKKQSLAAHK